MELAQDLKAIHGLDVRDRTFQHSQSTEILAEINREVIRSLYVTAVKGAGPTQQLVVSLTLTPTQTVVGQLKSSRV